MAKFIITGPDGKNYELTVPDGTSQEDALSFFKSQVTSAPEPDRFERLENEQRATREQLRAEGIPEEQISAIMQGGVSVSDIPKGAEAAVVNALRRSGAYQRRPADESRTLGRAAAIGQGVGFELMDEAIGMTQPEGFMRDVAKDEVQQLVEELPLSERIGLGLIGGLTTAGGFGAAGATLAKPGLGMWNNAGRAAAEGAGYGAAYGAGAADDDRLKGAAYGAAIGAPAGGVGSLALNRIGAGVNAVGGRMAAMGGKPDVVANNRIQNAVGGDATAIQQRLDDLGPDRVAMDGNESLRALGRSASNISPEAREIIEGGLYARQAGQTDRITDSILRAADLDEPKSLKALHDGIRAEAKPAIDAAYAAARQAGIDINLSEFSDIAQSEVVSVALAQGKKAARDRMIAEAAQAGKPLDEGAEPSALAVLDATKRVLEDMAETAMRSGERSKADIAGSYAGIIRDRVDNWVSEYADARGVARTMFERLDDLEVGSNLAKPRPERDALDAAANARNPLDVARGYAAGKVDAVEGRRATSGAVDSVFGSKRQRDALAAALGPKAADVDAQLARERAFGQTLRSQSGNSTTARQIAEMGAFPVMGAGAGFTYDQSPESAMGGLAAALLMRHGGGALLNAVSKGGEQKVATHLARLLMDPDLPAPVRARIQREHRLQNALLRGISGQAGAEVQPLQIEVSPAAVRRSQR